MKTPLLSSVAFALLGSLVQGRNVVYFPVAIGNGNGSENYLEHLSKCVWSNALYRS